MNTLLEEFKSGNLEHFDEFYNSTKKSVYYAIYLIIKDEMMTEDLMQETYVQFLEQIKKVPKDANMEGFLVTSAKNRAINYFNRHKREVEFSSSLVTYSYSNDKLLDTGLLKIVKDTLEEKECEVFLLHVLGEYTFQEISNMLGIPIGTLTWTYQESRKKLEAVLKKGER